MTAGLILPVPWIALLFKLIIQAGAVVSVLQTDETAPVEKSPCEVDMQCPVCGRIIADDARFCIYCDSEVGSAQPSGNVTSSQSYGKNTYVPGSSSAAASAATVSSSSSAAAVAASSASAAAATVSSTANSRPASNTHKPIVILLALVLAGALGYVVFSRFSKENAFDNGLKLMEEGRYREAIVEFQKSDDPSAAGKIELCNDYLDYARAVETYQSGDYAEAAEMFSALGGFQDSPEYAVRCMKELEELGIGYYICTAKPNLRIRSEPVITGKNQPSNKVGNIPQYEIVYVDGFDNDLTREWAHVNYKGITGWCSTEYLQWYSWKND